MPCVQRERRACRVVYWHTLSAAFCCLVLTGVLFFFVTYVGSRSTCMRHVLCGRSPSALPLMLLLLLLLVVVVITVAFFFFISCGGWGKIKL